MCRSPRELSNEYLLAKFGFDTAENEPCKVCPLSVYRSPRLGRRKQAQFVGALSPDVKLGTRNSWKFGIINSGLLVVSSFSCSPLLCLQHPSFFLQLFRIHHFGINLKGVTWVGVNSMLFTNLSRAPMDGVIPINMKVNFS